MLDLELPEIRDPLEDIPVLPSIARILRESYPYDYEIFGHQPSRYSSHRRASIDYLTTKFVTIYPMFRGVPKLYHVSRIGQAPIVYYASY